MAPRQFHNRDQLYSEKQQPRSKHLLTCSCWRPQRTELFNFKTPNLPVCKVVYASSVGFIGFGIKHPMEVALMCMGKWNLNDFKIDYASILGPLHQSATWPWTMQTSAKPAQFGHLRIKISQVDPNSTYHPAFLHLFSRTPLARDLNKVWHTMNWVDSIQKNRDKRANADHARIFPWRTNHRFLIGLTYRIWILQTFPYPIGQPAKTDLAPCKNSFLETRARHCFSTR